MKKAVASYGLTIPGKVSAIGWHLPANMPIERWVEAGLCLSKIEGAVQWWLGDWWAYGEHKYGERKALFEEGGPLQDMNFQTVANYGWVANSVTTSVRTEVLSWKHHLFVASLTPAKQRKWLALAVRKEWSSNELKAQIARAAALARTRQIEFDALALGKHVVLYGDPPWQYENAPMGGDNRAVEKEYPTMSLEQICALPVSDVAYENAVLFLWVTSPKLAESMQVLQAWEFECRTSMAWIKDRIGMGYHVREQHEILLIAKRGELPPPAVEARPSSVVNAPRLAHSAKPLIFYDIIDQMYPSVRKIELFGRNCAGREWWTFWGNQAAAEAAE